MMPKAGFEPVPLYGKPPTSHSLCAGRPQVVLGRTCEYHLEETATLHPHTIVEKEVSYDCAV